MLGLYILEYLPVLWMCGKGSSEEEVGGEGGMRGMRDGEGE